MSRRIGQDPDSRMQSLRRRKWREARREKIVARRAIGGEDKWRAAGWGGKAGG